MCGAERGGMNLRHLVACVSLLSACGGDRASSRGTGGATSSGPGTTSTGPGSGGSGGSGGRGGSSTGGSSAGGGGAGGGGGDSHTPGSTVDEEAAKCANTPLNDSGTIYYACDCASGADSDCEPGSDTNSGTDPS